MAVHKHFYCVCCNRRRSAEAPTRIGSISFFSHILLTTAFLTIPLWPWLHAKGFLALLLPVAICFEVTYRLKARGSLECPDCHFDPILYLSNRDQALKKVEEVWRKALSHQMRS